MYIFLRQDIFGPLHFCYKDDRVLFRQTQMSMGQHSKNLLSLKSL